MAIPASDSFWPDDMLAAATAVVEATRARARARAPLALPTRGRGVHHVIMDATALTYRCTNEGCAFSWSNEEQQRQQCALFSNKKK
jgi:hypothetical protein